MWALQSAALVSPYERKTLTVKGKSDGPGGTASRLGLAAGDVVGEVGYDDDVDEALRVDIENIIGTELLDGGSDEVFDAVLLWSRADDGDLTDDLVDVASVLADDGIVLLATPRPGFAGYIDASEIGDAANTAGLGQPSSGQPAGNWIVVKVTRSKAMGKSRR